MKLHFGIASEPFRAFPAPTGMDWMGVLGFFALWMALQYVVLPRLGVPT